MALNGSTPFKQIFGGKMIQDTTCTKCNKPSISTQPFMEIQVDIDTYNVGSIDQALTAYFRKKMVDGNV